MIGEQHLGFLSLRIVTDVFRGNLCSQSSSLLAFREVNLGPPHYSLQLLIIITIIICSVVAYYTMNACRRISQVSRKK